MSNSSISANKLESNYSFSNFTVGKTNKFAYAAATTVAECMMDNKYNPLFIYGPSGAGKTHLLHAIWSCASTARPDLCIAFINAHEYYDEREAAIQSSSVAVFQNKYKNADLFLIDDIQYLTGKLATQDELLGLIDSLYNQNKQIVFAYNGAPYQDRRLSEHFNTRYANRTGLLCDMLPPDDDLIAAIAVNKAGMHKLD